MRKTLALVIAALVAGAAGVAAAKKPAKKPARAPQPTVLPKDVKEAITERYSIPPKKTNEVLDALAPRCSAADLDGNGVDEWVIPLPRMADDTCYDMVLAKDASGVWTEKWNSACCDLQVIQGVKPSKKGPGHPAVLVCKNGGQVKPIFMWSGKWPPVGSTAPLWTDVTSNVDAAQKLVAQGDATQARRLTCTNRPMLGAPRPDVNAACAAADIALGDLAGAASALATAASVDPEYPSVFLYGGVIAEAKKDAAAAIAEYEKFLQGPDTPLHPQIKSRIERLKEVQSGKDKRWPPPLIRAANPAPAATPATPATPAPAKK